MKLRFAILITAFILLATFYYSCKKDETSSPNPTERERILEEYTNNYLGSATIDASWTGNASSCTPGTYSAEAMNKTIQRINYFRKMAGLDNTITFDPVKNAKCQEAALMMLANNSLNHFPPSTWSCYTSDGAEAAGNSNLAMGANASGAITLYMDDFGSGNSAVGHRRWILYSRASEMGAGSTSSTQALWVIGGTATPDTLPEFIAWPPKGYIPAPLVFKKWSFAIPGADFTEASLSMSSESGSTINCTVISNNNTSYGDNTIVWEPSGINASSLTDISYIVNVNNVLVNGSFKNYEYLVTIIQPK